MYKVSIIVTVYNTEKYVEKCIVSLINQTYENSEIILIDGGSTDNTTEICSKYEKKYKNIRLIHKENEGVSAARNRGILEAAGDYILFVDGDDWIEKTTVNTLVWLIEENNSDMAYILRVGNDYATGEVVIGDGKKMLLHILNTSSLEIWGKLFKKKIFENIIFPEGREQEDLYTIPSIVLKCKKVVAYHKGLYHYTIREDGLVGKMTKSDFYEVVECWLDGINRSWLLSNDKEFVRKLQKWYLYCALWYFYNVICLMDKNQFDKAAVNIAMFYKKTRAVYIKNPKVKIRDKIRFYMLSLSPSFVNNYNIFKYGKG